MITKQDVTNQTMHSSTSTKVTPA